MTLDIFRANPDAFSTRALADTVEVMPNMFGLIGDMGLFEDRPIDQALFQIESRNGVLQLVQSSPPGSPIQASQTAKRDMRNFSTRRFPQERRLYASDVAGVRQFGEEFQLEMVEQKVMDKLAENKASLDITREFLRAGALRGTVIEADGTVIANLFTEFGVVQKVVDFDFANADPATKAREVRRHIELNLLGDVMSGVGCLASPEFWDKLMEDEEFKRAHDFYMAPGNPQRDDVRKGFTWQGITWMEYLGQAPVPQEDGTTISQRFIPAGDANFFPIGTLDTFRMFNSPAMNFAEVNRPGEVYSQKLAYDDKYDEFVDVMMQTNCMPITKRPGVLVRGFSST